MARLRGPGQILLVALGATLVLLGIPAGSAPATTTPDGGTLLVVTPPAANGFCGSRISALDPAFTCLQQGSRPASIWYATCATLTAFPDAPAPDGLVPQPEAAAGPPAISRDGRTFVFTVRRGLRFSDGSALTARNFRRALSRVLDRTMASPGAEVFSDVGHVSSRGLKLRIVLNRPSGDLPTRLALPFACPVPLRFPVDPAGFTLTAGSGPYYIASYVPDKVIVLKRNRYYQGSRPHHADKVVVTIGGDLPTDIKAVEDGSDDVLLFDPPSYLRAGLEQQYGVNKDQLFRRWGWQTGALVLNTSSPLFKGNVALRQAINYAVDRSAIISAIPSSFDSRKPTDQVMPSGIPGWKDYRLYPLTGPDLGRAQKLAQGNLRGGRAILWTTPQTAPGRSIWPDETQVVVSNLRAIGLDVQPEVMAPDVIDAEAGTPGAPYDMILSEWPLEYPDPGAALVHFLGGENARKPSGNSNLAYFDEPAYDRRMAAADRLTGTARFRAFAKLDADIMRNQAPWAPLYEASTWSFQSKRVGCLRMQAMVVDLAAMCLR